MKSTLKERLGSISVKSLKKDKKSSHSKALASVEGKRKEARADQERDLAGTKLFR